MRISEKTVELNFCKGLPLILGYNLMWFGLTQKQEAQAGFDACARYGADLLIFQIKASRIVLRDGSRRFIAEHDQMQILRNQVRSNRRVFYVLPAAGTTTDFCGSLCFSHCSRYLDVSNLPATIPLPLAKGTKPPTVRKSNCHYIDMTACLSKATIHSDPFEVNLLSSDELPRTLRILSRDKNPTFNQDHERIERAVLKSSADFEEFWLSLSKIDRTGMVGAYAV